MVLVDIQLDAMEAFAVFHRCHTAATTFSTPDLEGMVCSVPVTQKCMCRLRLRQLFCIVEHEQPSLHVLPVWHLPPQSSSNGLESLHHQLSLLEVLHLQKQESWR